jgi:RNA polymerase sigma-70 factor (ECF subfamily)
LAAETFLKASRQLDVSRSEASIASWLFTVARTVLADHWRKYYRHGALLPWDELDIEPLIGTATPDTERTETERRVADTLEALPERYRRVLELRFLQGYSVAETAQELGVTPGNAKVLQYRALARAGQAWEQSEAIEPDTPRSDAACRTGTSHSFEDTT